MIFKYPVTQTINNPLAHNRMIAVNSISATREIHVVFFITVYKKIIKCIIKTTETKSNTVFIAFCSVIKNNIKNYFYSIFVHFFNQLLKLTDTSPRSFICGKICFWCKETHCAVAPIVFHPFTSAGIYVGIFKLVKFFNGHKFNCCNSQILKIWQPFHKSVVSSRTAYTIPLAGCKTFKMSFINNCVFHWTVNWLITFPVKIVTNNNTLWKFCKFSVF